MRLLIIFLFNGLFLLSYSQITDSAGLYKDQLSINEQNADSVNHFENTPESVCLYYAAARIRRDEHWKEVLPEEAQRSQRLQEQLVKRTNWSYVSITLLKRIKYSENRIFIKALMEFKINGQKESGKGDFEVTFTDGKWIITAVP